MSETQGGRDIRKTGRAPWPTDIAGVSMAHAACHVSRTSAGRLAQSGILVRSMGREQTGGGNVREGLFAIQLVGGAIACVGAVCLGAAPWPSGTPLGKYPWYARVFVVLFAATFASLTVILKVLAPPAKDAMGARGSSIILLMMDVSIVLVLSGAGAAEGSWLEVRAHDAARTTRHVVALGFRLLQAGIVVQLIPSILTILGVNTWK